jgi:hypothetical protein
MTRILAILSVAALLATAFAVSANAPPTFNARWSNSMKDLSEVQSSSAAQNKLHARALEIRREREEAGQ